MSEESYKPTSGRDLTLTLQGMLSRIEDGAAAYQNNLVYLLSALTGKERQLWEERAPEAVLRIRMALLKLGSTEQLKLLDQEIARERLALERERQGQAPVAEARGAVWGEPLPAIEAEDDDEPEEPAS